MKTKKQTWIKESNDCYTQGNYYKLNLSAFVQGCNTSYEIAVRNTWTGKKICFGYYRTKTEVRQALRNFTLANPVYMENILDKVKGL